MALNATTLKNNILTALQSSIIFNITGSESPNYYDEFIEILCDEIVDHIVNNAVVTTTSGAPDGEHTGNIT
jgi:hypothetical protein